MDARVDVEAGPVRGLVFDDYRLFQGIPYAAAPAGELRWRSPRPVLPWSGVRDATEPGSPSPQVGQVFADISSTDEDCLNLNVTTPDTARPDDLKPVMLWLHGGGGANGEGAVFDAHRLAVAEDVVVVTPNSRLGIFGYFGYPGLEGSGSFGLQDQQAALRWVRANIAAFGGDPGNVTLFGESYGAFNVCAHLVSPDSAGLFRRAIVQSGFALMDPPANVWMPGLPALPSMWTSTEDLQALGEHFAAERGWTSGGEDALEQLRRVPVQDLLEVSSVFSRPAFGSATLPEAPDVALRGGRFHRIPVVVGGTRDESRLFVGLFFDLAGQPVTAGRYTELLDEAFGPEAPQVAARYPLASYDTPSLAWAQVGNDRAWARPTWELTQAFAEHVPTYSYEFADRSAPPIVPFPDGFPPGAHHSAEVPYQFDLGGTAVDLDAGQRRLAERMNRYWANFARGSDPNSADLPQWPRFESTTPHVQSLAPGHVGNTDFVADHQLDFWAGLP